MPVRAVARAEVAGAAMGRHRFEQLVLVLADRLGEQETYSATMLDQALVACEVRHFRDHGGALTGAQAHRRTWGPALPALVTAQRHLVASGAARLVERSEHGRVQRLLEPVVAGDTEALTAEELRTVDAVVQERRHLTARQLSDRSRATPAWRSAAEGEAIPLAASLLHEGPVTGDDQRAARPASSGPPGARGRAVEVSGGASGLVETVGFAADRVAVRVGVERGEHLLDAALWMVARRGDDPVLCPEVAGGLRVGRAAPPGQRRPLLRVWFRHDRVAHRTVLLAGDADQRLHPPEPPHRPAPSCSPPRQENH